MFGSLKQIAAAFVLAAMFFAVPFTELGKDEPWFWIASGGVSCLVGSLLIWIFVETHKNSSHEPERIEDQVDRLDRG
jgi:hypothetical protein